MILQSIFFTLIAFARSQVFEIENSINVSEDEEDDVEGFYDAVYDQLALISCNNFTSCQIEYTHVITNVTEQVDMSETEDEDDENDADFIGTDGFIVLSGRFPAIVPDCCVEKIVELHDNIFCKDGNCENDICPGVHQLQDDQRPVMDLIWSKMKPADVVLEPFEPDDDFKFSQSYNGEYFHMHKSSHLFVNGVHYFIGGEKYYSLNDGTNFVDKEFNSGIWQLKYDGVVKTNFRNIYNISRAASAVTNFGVGGGEVGYICGSLFNPKECFTFDGIRLTKESKLLTRGHTDEAVMIFTQAFGLFIIGGGEDVNYLNNKGDVNPNQHTRHGTVETRVNSAGSWVSGDCMNHQDAVIGSAIVELGANIWMFGGHGSSWPAANVYYLRTNEDCPKWNLHSELLSPRSGHVAVVNNDDKTVLLVGGSLQSMNKPVEMWTFTSKWGTSGSSIKKLDSRDVSNDFKKT